MSPETQKNLGLNDEQVDFDEFLQRDAGEARDQELSDKLNIRQVQGNTYKTRHATGHRAVAGLKKAKI